MIGLETRNNNEKICHFLTLFSKAQHSWVGWAGNRTPELCSLSTFPWQRGWVGGGVGRDTEMAGSPAASCVDLLQICQLCVLWKSWGPNFVFPTSFLYFWVLKQSSRRGNTVTIVNKNENFLCCPLVRKGEVEGARKPPLFSVHRKFWVVRSSLQ